MQGQGHAGRTGSPPQEPTAALPGTEAKIQVMIERAARRESLFHPLDGLVRAPEPQAPAPPWWLAESGRRVAATLPPATVELLRLPEDDGADDEDDAPPLERAS